MCGFLSKYNKRQWTVLVGYGFVQMLGGMVYSIQAPFYPQEAINKGMSASEYGIVFGIYELVTFLYGPVVDKKTKHFTLRCLFYFGVVTIGLSTLAFGFLTYINGHWTFFSASILLRILEAMGATTMFVSLNSSVIAEFPDEVATACAIMQTMLGVGLSIGPTVGGLLYEVGGYILPFEGVGGLLFITAAVVAFWLPPQEGMNKASEGEVPTLLKLLRNPANILSYLAIFCTTVSITGLITNLQPATTKAGLSSITVDLLFLAYAGTFALSGPLWGYLCDRMTELRGVTILGCISVAIGYCLIGPAAFIPTDQTLGLLITGLLLCGLGYGAVNVSSFLSIVRHTTKAFPGASFIHTTASGLYLSAFSLGAFVGPILAGVLYDSVGFRNIAYLVLGLQSVLVLVYISTLIFFRRKKSGKAGEDGEKAEIGSFLPAAGSNSQQDEMKVLQEKD